MKGDYRISYYEIKSPVWQGGNRQIGLAPGRIAGIDELRINISVRYKTGKLKGELIFPDTYSISSKFFHSYNGEWQTLPRGTKLKLFLIEDLPKYIPDISYTKKIMKDDYGIDEEPIILREIKNTKLKE